MSSSIRGMSSGVLASNIRDKFFTKMKRCGAIKQIINMCAYMQHVIIRGNIGIETRIIFRLTITLGDEELMKLFIEKMSCLTKTFK